MLHMPLPLAAQWSKRILAGEGDAKSQNPVLRQNACSDWFGMLRTVWVYLGLGFAKLPRWPTPRLPLESHFFKPLMASLDVSWSNFTSLFSDGGLTEPRLGSPGLSCEVSGLFLKRHWPPLSGPYPPFTAPVTRHRQRQVAANGAGGEWRGQCKTPSTKLQIPKNPKHQAPKAAG